MGYFKELMLEQQEAGYAHLPGKGFICPECVQDPFLQGEIAETAAEESSCTFCEARPAADLNVLLAAVGDYLKSEYEDPAHSLPYDGREGGYQGVVYMGNELVYDLEPWLGSDEVIEEVARVFGGSAWCERDYYSMKDDEKLRFGWATFVDLIKHRTRYLFFPEEGDDGEAIPPAEMLRALGDLIDEFELFSQLAAGETIVRARVHPTEEKPEGVEELGPPPREKAVMSNRMSPAGVPMFYGAFDDATAIAETFDPTRAQGKVVTLARFTSKRVLNLLDLTSLPAFPSPFDREARHLRRPLGFLYEFVNDLTKPVARDGWEHVEYVPTQVVTEFVRHRHRTPKGDPIDGIRYRSSRTEGDDALVVFVENDQCGPRKKSTRFDPDPVLVLTGQELVRLPES